MRATTPQFPIVPNGYSPAHVDEFVLRLVRRARGDIADLRAQIEDLEAELERYRRPEQAARAVAEVPEPKAEEVDWALAAIGRSPYDSWSEEDRQRAARSLRGRRMSACG